MTRRGLGRPRRMGYGRASGVSRGEGLGTASSEKLGGIRIRTLKQEKLDRLTILFDRIGIKTAYIGQVINDKWSLERAITKSKSPYIKFIDIVGGPKRSTVKQKPYKFSGVLPGSFESNKR